MVEVATPYPWSRTGNSTLLEHIHVCPRCFLRSCSRSRWGILNHNRLENRPIVIMPSRVNFFLSYFFSDQSEDPVKRQKITVNIFGGGTWAMTTSIPFSACANLYSSKFGLRKTYFLQSDYVVLKQIFQRFPDSYCPSGVIRETQLIVFLRVE